MAFYNLRIIVIHNKMCDLHGTIWYDERAKIRTSVLHYTSIPCLFDDNLTTQRFVNTTISIFKQTAHLHCIFII
jgi:hypothetical protein